MGAADEAMEPLRQVQRAAKKIAENSGYELVGFLLEPRLDEPARVKLALVAEDPDKVKERPKVDASLIEALGQTSTEERERRAEEARKRFVDLDRKLREEDGFL